LVGVRFPLPQRRSGNPQVAAKNDIAMNRPLAAVNDHSDSTNSHKSLLSREYFILRINPIDAFSWELN
jgi:hypothetical protein